MSIRLSRTASTAAAAVAALVVLSGCSEDKQAKQRCLDEAQNAAEAAAVARMYDAGKLGSRKKVEAELGTPERPGSDYFDSSGHLLPYRRLPSTGHKIQFLLWIRLDSRVAELTYIARTRAIANMHPDC